MFQCFRVNLTYIFIVSNRIIKLIISVCKMKRSKPYIFIVNNRIIKLIISVCKMKRSKPNVYVVIPTYIPITSVGLWKQVLKSWRAPSDCPFINQVMADREDRRHESQAPALLFTTVTSVWVSLPRRTPSGSAGWTKSSLTLGMSRLGGWGFRSVLVANTLYFEFSGFDWQWLDWCVEARVKNFVWHRDSFALE